MDESSKEWFSSAELAALGAALVAGLATSKPGIAGRADRERWPSRQVPGRGGKGGLKTEYMPPQAEMAAIKGFLKVHPTFFGRSANQESALYNLAPTEVEAGSVEVTTNHGAIDADNNNNGVVYVNQYMDVRGAAGTGQFSPDDQLVVKVAFNEVALRNQTGVLPKNLVIITVYGDSMEPILSHGDSIFVDKGVDHFIDNAIYVIQQQERLRIKRIQLRLDGSVAVKSENDAGFPMEIYSKEEAQDFVIFGRVIPIKMGRFKI